MPHTALLLPEGGEGGEGGAGGEGGVGGAGGAGGEGGGSGGSRGLAGDLVGGLAPREGLEGICDEVGRDEVGRKGICDEVGRRAASSLCSSSALSLAARDFLRRRARLLCSWSVSCSQKG